MKTDKEGLGGYVADSFSYYQIKSSNKYHDVVSFFGSDVDKICKTDYQWKTLDFQYRYGDCKGSIRYPNCSVELNHPFFKQKATDSYNIIFPFKDETELYIVNAYDLYENILKNKNPLHGKHDYYLVSVDDIKTNLDTHSYSTIVNIGRHKTFGEFFDAFFKGDELVGMKNDEVIDYVKNMIDPLCRDEIFNY